MITSICQERWFEKSEVGNQVESNPIVVNKKYTVNSERYYERNVLFENSCYAVSVKQ
jgi:hypothetical protein